MGTDIARIPGPAVLVAGIGETSGFPSDVAVCIRAITADLMDHPLATSSEISGAIPVRRREYAAGRVCARAALRFLGVQDAALGRTSDGMPCWPEGFVGSIAHSGKQAIAAAAPAGSYRSIGIDVEDVSAVSPEIWPEITTARELAFLSGLRAQDRQWAAATIFSAKEAFYKCQFPLTQQFLDFQDVEIAIRLRRFSVTLKCRGPVCNLGENSFRGAVCASQGEVVTLVDLLV